MPGRQNQNYDIGNHYDNSAAYNVAAAGTTNLADQINPTGRGVKVGVNITALVGGTLTVTIQGKDEQSGNYYTLLASAAIAATGFTLLTVYPGLTAAANVVASDVLPNTWRLSAVAGVGVTSAIATFGASILL